MKRSITLAICLFMAVSTLGFAEKPFVDVVGPVTVGDVKNATKVQVPLLTWGADYATIYANGGKTTQPGSIFGKLGLNIELSLGDDFPAQVRDYKSGKTPFIRGTFHMLALASEAMSQDQKTKPAVFLQLSRSTGGDNCVVRSDKVKTIADLKGKKVTLQANGPHVGFLDDILKTAQLNWDDITVVWTDNLTGPNSPAELFRKDQSIDCCFAITPDMLGLCGASDAVGSGAEGTVKGAKVLVSTAQLSNSIIDVYGVRKDFYDANRDWVTKFTAGYLKGCEEVSELKKQYEAKKDPAPYFKVLQLAQDMFGKEALPTLENDAHGLLCDCTFAGYPGNVAFFTEKGNLVGFEPMQESAINLAFSRGYTKVKTGFFPSGLDYSSSAFVGYLKNTAVTRTEKFRAEAVQSEFEALSSGALDDKTIYSFAINFDPNQSEFSAIQYGAEFQRVVELAAKYGNAVILIRGHADPTKVLFDVVKAGIAKGVIKQSGTKGGYQYFIDGQELNLSSTSRVIELINAGQFDGVASNNPRETMQSALNLSRQRAETVRDSIVGYAVDKGLNLDKSQIQPIGVGVREPLIAKPANMADAQKNMRVEFRLVRVQAEAMTDQDFNF